MQTLACQPCAKRKVRCDRKEPCSNCKRRTQDRCVYADVSTPERIKQLEALVRSLGGKSEYSTSHDSYHGEPRNEAALASSQVPPRNDISSDVQCQSRTEPMLVKEDGEYVYLES